MNVLNSSTVSETIQNLADGSLAVRPRGKRVVSRELTNQPKKVLARMLFRGQLLDSADRDFVVNTVDIEPRAPVAFLPIFKTLHYDSPHENDGAETVTKSKLSSISVNFPVNRMFSFCSGV